MKRKNRRIYYYLAALALTLVVAALAVAYSHHQPTVTVTPQTSTTPEVSPGQPGNPGDQTKSGYSPTPKPTTAKTASPTPGANTQTITVADFTVAPRAGGQIHVASTVTGTTAGACTLGLTSPQGNVRSVTGAVTNSGTYFNCSFATIDGVTETGTWKASLSVTNGSQTSNVAQTTFQE
jgi:hypothetical protein